MHYAAIEAAGPGATIVDSGPNSFYANATSTAYLVSGDQLGVTKFFPDTFDETSPGSGVRPICSGCEFIKWGAWGARVAFNNGPQSTQYVDNIHLAWWVAGDLSTRTQIDTLAALNASATYNGHVLGNVASRVNSNDWRTYVAGGDLAMNWSFAQRAGDLAINNFDGRSYATNANGLSQPSLDINRFSGALHQVGGPLIGNMNGGAVGSFVNDGPNRPAAGVIGNWNVEAQNYRATGIFAGSGNPVAGNH